MTTTGEHLVASSTIETGTALAHFAALAIGTGRVVEAIRAQFEQLHVEVKDENINVEVEVIDGKVAGETIDVEIGDGMEIDL